MVCRALFRRFAKELLVLDSVGPAGSLASCRTVTSGSTSGSLKRFYDRATVTEAKDMPVRPLSTHSRSCCQQLHRSLEQELRLVQGHWSILLDGKRVKTPAREPLAVPSHLIACAIAAEFQYQSTRYVRFSPSKAVLFLVLPS